MELGENAVDSVFWDAVSDVGKRSLRGENLVRTGQLELKNREHIGLT